MKDTTALLLLLIVAFLFLKKKKTKAAKALPAPAPKPVKIAPGKPTNWLSYRELLATKESAGKYDARRPRSRYWGRYQLGPNARKIGGAQGIKWADYSKNESLQDAAVKSWTKRLLTEITANTTTAAAIGKTLHGEKVTAALLVAMDHLTGRAATLRWVRTGKTTNDGNGVANLTYARPFRDFDLSELNRKVST